MEMGTHDPARNLPEGWVTLPGGGIVPAKLDRATGWQADRDTVNTSALIHALAEVDRTAKLFADCTDGEESLAYACDFHEAWTAYRVLIGGDQ